MMTFRERWIAAQAYKAGYAHGHDDTVKFQYNCMCVSENDCAFEWLDEQIADNELTVADALANDAPNAALSGDEVSS